MKSGDRRLHRMSPYVENGKKLEDESSEDMECSECHMKNGKGRMDLIKAYHDNCKGCHKKLKKGPVMCGECHNDKKLKICSPLTKCEREVNHGQKNSGDRR